MNIGKDNRKEYKIDNLTSQDILANNNASVQADRKDKIMNEVKNIPEMHCHVRSQYDAMQFAENLCDRLDELGMEGCAITDHGTVSSIEEYYKVFNKRNKKLVPGVELYVDGGVLGRVHFLLHAMDDEGWHCIQNIVTELHHNMQKEFPVIKEKALLNMLSLHKGHVAGSTACMQGIIAAIFRYNEKIEEEISKIDKQLEEYADISDNNIKVPEAAVSNAYKDQEERLLKFNALEAKKEELKKSLKSDEELHAMAKKKAILYNNAFDSGYFHMEIMYHGIEAEKKCMIQIAKLAKELDIPMMATNDAHITSKTSEDRLRRCLIRSMRPRRTISFLNENVGDSELYIKSDVERMKYLTQIVSEKDAQLALYEAQKVFIVSNVKFEYDNHSLAMKKTLAGTCANANVNKEFLKMIQQGSKKRFPEGMSEEYKERANREYKVLAAKAPLSIPEFKKLIKEKGYKTLDTCGSLICYLLGLTNIDPIKNNFSFEQFLDFERIIMSDIKNVPFTPKEAIVQAARFYGLYKDGQEREATGNKYQKIISDMPGISFSSLVDLRGKPTDDKEIGKPLFDYLLNIAKDDNEAKQILMWARTLEKCYI